MRIVRVGDLGSESPGILVDEDNYLDLSAVTDDVDGAFLKILNGLGDDRDVLKDLPIKSLAGKRLGAPIATPSKIICIGMNFADHALLAGVEKPAEPIFFLKAPNTMVGPNDDVRVPKTSQKTDWEVELGVVIGSECRYLESPEEARGKIVGYVLSHDVSERAFQFERGGQWDKGKCCETFNPCGPFLATREEIHDVQDLAMWLDVNGSRMQSGSTATMIFPIDYLIWYLSQFMVLEPGDLVNTATPPGVGMGMDPPLFLKSGDVVELGIEGLGSQRQVLVEAPP